MQKIKNKKKRGFSLKIRAVPIGDFPLCFKSSSPKRHCHFHSAICYHFHSVICPNVAISPGLPFLLLASFQQFFVQLLVQSLFFPPFSTINTYVPPFLLIQPLAFIQPFAGPSPSLAVHHYHSTHYCITIVVVLTW